MMKSFSITLFILFLGFNGFSQKVEAGIMVGGMFYNGDLTEKLISDIHPSGGMFLRINMNGRVSLKGNVIVGTISASDKDASSASRKLRNLSFSSKISEFAAEVEINLVNNYREKNIRTICVPYLFFGLNVFHFNPQADLVDSATGRVTTYELQPLGTEGQGLTKYPELKRYNLNAFAFPLGGGVKFHVGEYLTMGLELGMRKTLTDYLDDVSGFYAENDLIKAQYGPTAGKLADRSGEVVPGYENPKNTVRGNSSNQDWYGFGGVLISYTFIKKSKIRCSTF
jgi:hypothetical protein